MDAVWYTSPYGDLIKRPSLDNIIWDIYSKGEAYWNSDLDNGFASLSRLVGNEEVASLTFTKKDGFGFHFKFNQYESAVEQRQSFFSVASDDYTSVAQVNLAGSPIFLPRCFFVEDAVAEQIVRAFFAETDWRSQGIWKRIDELDWDLGKEQRLNNAIDNQVRHATGRAMENRK